MFYTYMHTRNDTGQPFYIGKGAGYRAYINSNRSQHWKNVAKKHGRTVHILAHWLTEAEAFDHERCLIACMRDIGAPIINRTDGGEGVSGRKLSQDSIRKISDAQRGEKSRLFGRPLSSEHRAKLSASLKGRKHGPAWYAACTGHNSVRARRVLCVENGLVFLIITEASNWLVTQGFAKATPASITSAASGKRKTAYGYHWKYIDN